MIELAPLGLIDQVCHLKDKSVTTNSLILACRGLPRNISQKCHISVVLKNICMYMLQYVCMHALILFVCKHHDYYVIYMMQRRIGVHIRYSEESTDIVLG